MPPEQFSFRAPILLNDFEKYSYARYLPFLFLNAFLVILFIILIFAF